MESVSLRQRILEATRACNLLFNNSMKGVCLRGREKEREEMNFQTGVSTCIRIIQGLVRDAGLHHPQKRTYSCDEAGNRTAR